jgi:hypothetical protein
MLMTIRTFTRIVSLWMALAPMAAHAQSDDAPDLNKEAKFHHIYEQYNAQPTDAEKWQSALGEAHTQTYDVQRGDTLWDISDTLFADSDFWPKVWSLNVETIGNPHEIDVGQRIQFTPGTAGEPPQLLVTKKNADGILGNGHDLIQDEKPQGPIKFDLSKVNIPPPSHPPRPVTAIPGSLPKWKYGGAPSEVVSLDLQSPKVDFGHPPEILTAYVSDVPPASIGKVTEIEAGVDAAVEYQYVVVQLPEKTTEKNLLVVKDGGEIKDPNTGEKGHVIRVLGELEIQDEVNPDRHLYRAMVTRSVDLIEVGNELVLGKVPVYDTSTSVAKGTAAAEVIGGADGMDRKIFGSHTLIFLNGGSGKGMVTGSVYPLYKKQSLRAPTDEVQNPRQIGHVKVLKVGNNFATAVITDAKEDVQIGDTTSMTHNE